MSQRLLMAGVLFAACASAQSPDPDIVRANHDSVLRRAPNADATVAFQIPAGSELILVARSVRNDFYRVIRKDRGPQAWISVADATLIHKTGASPSTKACAATLQQCPAHGCAEAGTAEAESNELKRRQPKVGVPMTLSFADFAGLQQQADERVGEGPFEPTSAQRAQLQNLQVKSGHVSEGDLVRVVAFIAKGDEGLHTNKEGESVNCLLKKPSDNDIHIPLVDAPGNTEYQGMVAEMIPQDRPQAWSVEALRDIQANGLKIWVEGGLSYDKVHFVDDDSDNPIKDEPARMSLWEIHPITKFLVCRKPRCDPQFEQDWTPLEAQ